MHVEYCFTGDGILAFLGGAFAILAVLLSNRVSKNNLQKQIDTEKQARQQERMQRKRALATALLYEIWDLDCHHVKTFVAKDKSVEHVRFFSRSFPVWVSNAGQMGQFAPDVVKELVHFYDVAAEYLATFDRYFSLENDAERQNKFFQEVLAPRLRKLDDLAEKAWRGLCPVASVEPSSLSA
jgi:hypothetical protein